MLNFFQSFKKNNINTSLLKKNYSLTLLIVLILTIALFTIIDRNYFSVNNLQSILSNAGWKGVLVIGELIVILSGNFDLSIGSIVGLSSLYAMIFSIIYDIPTPIIVLIILISGAFFGFLNGFFVNIVGINSIITTLGMSFIITSFAYLLQRIFLEVTYSSNIQNESLTNIATGKITFLPKVFLYPLILFILIGIILKFTSFGRSLFIVGGGEKLAKITGFKVKKIRIVAFIISGICASLGGILLVSQLSYGKPDLAVQITLDIIIIVVLGGTVIGGGKSDIYGVFIIWLFIEALSNGLVMLGVSYYLRQSFTGVLLIFAIALSSAKTREFYS